MEENVKHIGTKVARIQPDYANGLIKNASELLEAARANDVESLVVAWRRKSNANTRTYRYGETEMLYFTIDLLKRDLIAEYCGVDPDGE